RLAAGERIASRPADRRQRHQQGRRRVLSPRLQQRLRRPRVFAAADECLRPAPADQTQSTGFHRLVHSQRHRKQDDSGVRRRVAASRSRVRGRRGGRVSARRGDRRLQRRGVQRRRGRDGAHVIQTRIPFMSLAPHAEEAGAIRAAIDRVIASGRFVLGAELEAFETEFAGACGATHAVGVGNGTDALALALRAMGIGSGDEVITTPLSAAFTALAVMMVGATPVFADIDPVRLTIDPTRIAALIAPQTRAILPVHLYGQPADMTPILRLANTHNLALVEDCCQAHLATAESDPVGTIGDAGAFSFYPTKNLGAFGDGGAIVVPDAAFADELRRMRNGGQRDRYSHEQFGVNSRLDEIQAAILRAKLPGLAAATARRRAIAAAYCRLLQDAPVEVPPECDPG